MGLVRCYLGVVEVGEGFVGEGEEVGGGGGVGGAEEVEEAAGGVDWVGVGHFGVTVLLVGSRVARMVYEIDVFVLR